MAAFHFFVAAFSESTYRVPGLYLATASENRSSLRCRTHVHLLLCDNREPQGCDEVLYDARQIRAISTILANFILVFEQEHVKQLTTLEVEEIHGTGAPVGDRHILCWKPPDRSPYSDSADVAVSTSV